MRFVVVYQREPHARQMAFRDVRQPTNRLERIELARRARREFRLDVDIWIDDLSDASRAAFGDLPHFAVVLDGAGRIRHKLPWADPDELAKALAHLGGFRQRAAIERSFLAAVKKPLTTADDATPAQIAARRHDRQAMLAWLVERQPNHRDRPRWLHELAATGALCQRQWATALLRTLPPPPPRKPAPERDTMPAASTSPGGTPSSHPTGPELR